MNDLDLETISPRPRREGVNFNSTSNLALMADIQLHLPDYDEERTNTRQNHRSSVGSKEKDNIRRRESGKSRKKKGIKKCFSHDIRRSNRGDYHYDWAKAAKSTNTDIRGTTGFLMINETGGSTLEVEQRGGISRPVLTRGRSRSEGNLAEAFPSYDWATGARTKTKDIHGPLGDIVMDESSRNSLESESGEASEALAKRRERRRQYQDLEKRGILMDESSWRNPLESESGEASEDLATRRERRRQKQDLEKRSIRLASTRRRGSSSSEDLADCSSRSSRSFASNTRDLRPRSRLSPYRSGSKNRSSSRSNRSKGVPRHSTRPSKDNNNNKELSSVSGALASVSTSAAAAASAAASAAAMATSLIQHADGGELNQREMEIISSIVTKATRAASEAAEAAKELANRYGGSMDDNTETTFAMDDSSSSWEDFRKM